MATKSFDSKFQVNNNSFDCFQKVLSSDKITILNCTKKVRPLNKVEVLERMKNAKK
ncbi:hypothetical protein [Tannockella kyphosi]|uniref:hypothetical protein n=1 Tax=Tannockella kyphosi TaxID=2899121 RepID=UPI0020130AB1|nr:hypothetical protein [Tannockella kyphosi]